MPTKTVCFAPLRGRRIRVTRIDNIGRIMYGPAAMVTSDSFTTVNMTGEVEEGEDITVKNAAGELCISEKGEDQLKWLNVEISFCSVDPDLVTMMNPNWIKLADYKGNTIGWAETYNYSADSGVALELWTDISNHVETDPHAQGAWVYFLLSWIVGGTIGDITVENGAITFTLTGRTKKGGLWGVGPYDVMLNAPVSLTAPPLPGPLLLPVGPQEPRRVFVTTVRPPAPLCGAQPLSSPVGPAVAVTEVVSDTTRYTVGLTLTAASGSYRVDWNDGSTAQTLTPGTTPTTHTYSEAGTYNIAVWPTATPADVAVYSVQVPFTGVIRPGITLVENTTDTTDRRSVTLRVDNHSNGPVMVDWNDGSANSTNAGDGTATSNHTYASAGTYNVTVTDANDPTLTSSAKVRVPFGQPIPTITITEDTADPSRRRIKVATDNHGNGPLVVNWGDAATAGSSPGDGTTTISHTYAAPGTFTVTVVDPDDQTSTASQQVTVPWGPTMTTAATVSDPDKMSTTVTVNNYSAGAVTIDWGDASTDSTNPGDGTTTSTHKYDDDGTYTITATDDTDPTRSTTATVTVPYAGSPALTLSVVESAPPGSPRRKVTATWDNQGQGPVNLTWAVGDTPTQQAESGTLDHTYLADGTYTVRVTDVSLPSRTTAVVVTVPFTT